MSAPSRGGTSARGRRVVAPRGPGRRSQAERTQRQQDEQVRTHAREAEYAHQVNEQRLAAEKAERARQRAQAAAASRRGRGGFMGDGGSTISSGPTTHEGGSGPEPTRSGPLSDGSVITAERKQTYPRNWAPAKRGRTGNAKRISAVKREGGEEVSTSATVNAGPSQQPANQLSLDESDADQDEESDDSGGGPRVDVDYINLISDDEESDSSQTARARFAPVRVDRVPHRDRAPQINPEASSSNIKKQESDTIQLSSIPLSSTNQRGKQRAKDVEIIEVTRPWRGVYEEEQPDRIVKREPGSPPSVQTVSRDTSMPDVSTAAATGPRASTKRRANRTPVFSTDEDRQEWERHNAELRTMVDELGLTDCKPVVDANDTEAGKSTQDEPSLVDKKQDRVYLFQFPPVVPNLLPNDAMHVDYSPSSVTQPISHKDDKKPHVPNRPVQEVAVPLTASNTADPSSSGNSTNINHDTSSTNAQADHLPKLSTGRVGKLKVYKSGKATLDWGGTSLQLNMGTSPFFLQDSVMVRMHPSSLTSPSTTRDASQVDGQVGAAGLSSSNGAAAEASSSLSSSSAPRARQADAAAAAVTAGEDVKEGDETQVAGEAFAFGQIRGKFIVTPDWDEVLG